MNSWGEKWGIAPAGSKATGGFFWIPYQYILDDYSTSEKKLHRFSNRSFFTPYVVSSHNRKDNPTILEQKRKKLKDFLKTWGNPTKKLPKAKMIKKAG